MNKYVSFIIVLLAPLSSQAIEVDFSKTRPGDFKKMWFYSRAENSKEFSPCQRNVGKALKAQRFYDSCTKVPGGIPNSIGQCKLKNATEYFFKTQKDCDNARSDAVSGAAS